MTWLEVTVTTAPPAVEAIADIFLEARSGGVAETSLPSGLVRLRGYLPVGPATRVTLLAIRRRIRALPACGLDAGPARLRTREIDGAGWAEAWKDYFRPFAVGRLWIAPTWDRTPPPPGSAAIRLDPGLAFGSGLHPSTRLCLEVLAGHLRGGEVVFDVGTGSGILAIAAARLGAARVLAIDVDPVAVKVAGTNVAHNAAGDRVTVRKGDMLRGVKGRAHLITANLTADLHLALLPAARPRLRPAGILAASGIAQDRLPAVRSAARAAGFAIAATRRRGEWRCLVLAAGSR